MFFGICVTSSLIRNERYAYRIADGWIQPPPVATMSSASARYNGASIKARRQSPYLLQCTCRYVTKTLGRWVSILHVTGDIRCLLSTYSTWQGRSFLLDMIGLSRTTQVYSYISFLDLDFLLSEPTNLLHVCPYIMHTSISRYDATTASQTLLGLFGHLCVKVAAWLLMLGLLCSLPSASMLLRNNELAGNTAFACNIILQCRCQ